MSQLDAAANPNTNCLAGKRCPECGSYGPFNIQVTVMMEVSDDGTGDPTGDTEWDEQSPCECRECSHTATVAEFTEEEEA